MAVAAAGGDHMRIGDGDVVQVIADDRVRPAIEFTAERGSLHFGLAKRAVREQKELRHGAEDYAARTARTNDATAAPISSGLSS
jgi:hypothetical protein